MKSQIEMAIREKRVVEFTYHGHLRIVELHIYGQKDGIDQVLAYQTDGSSTSGGLPEWRRFDVAEMSGLVVLTQTFPGPRQTSGDHSPWDVQYLIVQ